MSNLMSFSEAGSLRLARRALIICEWHSDLDTACVALVEMGIRVPQQQPNETIRTKLNF